VNREQYVELVSPLNVLRRGYTLTLKEGRIITSLKELKAGDTIETYFKDGSSSSVVTGVNLSDDPTEARHA
jgi:exodeoxyribonuclease VII large subunit